MVGGLAPSSRKWIVENMMTILKKHGGKASAGVILAELNRMPHKRVPMNKDRVIAFLKYMQAIGLVQYNKSLTKKVASEWKVGG